MALVCLSDMVNRQGFFRGKIGKNMNKLPKIQITKKPIYLKLGQDIDFYELFEKIEQQFDTCFIFESLGEEGKFARYSIIGFDPECVISSRDIDYFDLRKLMPKKTVTRNYCGGLIGYLSYDAVNFFEPQLKIKIHPLFEQFLFGVYKDGIILDKLTGEIFYFYYDKNRSQLLREVIKSPIKKGHLKVKSLGDSIDRQTHAKIVGKVLDEIKKGNIFQCEVGFKSEFKISGNFLKIYEKLRKINPSPFMYFLKFKDKKIIGASPELLFGLREGEMQTNPLAGTIRRGKNEKEDQKLAHQLLSDPKEKAEHNMILDLHRNDMGRVAQFGTVKVRNLMGIKKFSHVQHISSEVAGIIKEGEDQFSALASNFPTGTLTGAPKIEAMKIIERNESEARGPYGGAVGQFGFNGDCTFAIAIRSLFVKGDYAFTQTSGGIVYDSKPEKEFEEISRKLSAMKEVLS